MGAPEDMGPSPWAGSLRHVDKNKMRKKKEKRQDGNNSLYNSYQERYKIPLDYR